MIIRPLTKADLAEVVQAEHEPPAWTAAQFEEELALSFAWQLVAYVPESLQFAGYLCWRTVADEAEIMKLAVTPSLRRHGIAHLLLFTALKHIAEQGFMLCGLRKKYYTSPCEDALILKYQI